MASYAFYNNLPVSTCKKLKFKQKNQENVKLKLVNLFMYLPCLLISNFKVLSLYREDNKNCDHEVQDQCQTGS